VEDMKDKQALASLIFLCACPLKNSQDPVDC